MAKDPDDIEALLAEVNQTLAGPAPGRAPARTASGSTAAAPPPSARVSPVARSLMPAVVVAGVVGALFWIVPFLGSASGAAGAFLGAILTALWLQLRR